MPRLSDPLLPAVDELLGPGAGPLIRTVVEAAGGTLVGYDRQQVLYRPGDRAAVRFGVRVRWASGQPTEETIVAVTTVDGPPEGTLVLSAGALAVGLFRYPHDPALPGLPVATFADRLERWLTVGGEPELRVRSYRPTRRAVVHARWSRDGLPPVERYVKCVPPGEHARIEGWLTSLRRAVPVPIVATSRPDQGLLALEALPGRPIRDVLLHGSAADLGQLPDGRAILDVLDRLPAPTGAMAAGRPGPVERAAAHAALLATVLPDVAARVQTLVGDLDQAVSLGPDVLVHGDLYDGQVLVDEGGISGLLDLDDAGRGRRLDDLATFVAHLEALAETVPGRREAIAHYESRVRPAFDLAAGRDDLATVTAAAMIGLATGPFRVQQRDWPRRVANRLELAERWAAEADRSRVTRGSPAIPA